MKTIIYLGGFLLALSLRAQDEAPSLMLSAPSAVLQDGGAWSIQLVALNPQTTTLYYHPPSVLVAHMTGVTQPVEFRTHENAALVIAPGTFGTRLYIADHPPSVTGTIVLEFDSDLPGPLRTAIRVEPKSATNQDKTASAGSLRNLTNPPLAVSALERTFAGRLGLHEPIYFIYGPDAPAAKFQISFKYKLMDLNQPAPGSFTNTLQFGYTQRSLWDINSVSSPFYDTSYMPELMLESFAPMPTTTDRWLTLLGAQLAFKHESNGRDGPDSRSLNTVNLRAAAMLGPIDNWHLIALPEVFAYVTSLQDNPDLKNYRGYGQLRLGIVRDARRPSLLYTVRAGANFDHWTQQFDLAVPLRTKWLNIETSLLVQYFNGYGESLLSYKKKSETVRAGISLVR